MILTDKVVNVHETAEAAFSLIKAKGFAPTPKCYALWYAFFSGADPELERILNKVVKGTEELTDRRVHDLYAQFFETDMEAEAIRQAGAMIEASVTKVIEKLNNANAESARYGERLENYSGKLQRGPKPGEIQTIIESVLGETKKMRERSEQIAGDIKESSLEIVELRRNLENVRREAHTDALTGIANRRSFDERLRLAFREAKEANDTVSLLMIDIDFFKKFNDSYGHQLGDRVLQLVARILKTSIKGRDMVARYGGEEFAVILPSTRLAGAATLGDQIREAVVTRHIIQKRTGEDLGTISLSVGVANLRSGDSAESLIKRADEALYTAKRNGRNRVVTEEQVGRPMAV